MIMPLKPPAKLPSLKVPVVDNQVLLKELYTNHVCITKEGIAELELKTRMQSNSELWHRERVLCMTSPICHRRDSTNSFILKKLTQIDVYATCYGRHREKRLSQPSQSLWGHGQCSAMWFTYICVISMISC